MAITFIGANQVAGTSVSIPAHQAGDLILMFAYRSSSATAPSVPGGGTGPWTTVNSSGGNTNSAVVAYRIATGPGTTSGTWTNATHLHVSVYRGASQTNPIGTTAVTGAANSTIVVPGLTLQRSDGTSVVWNAHGHRSASTNIAAPSGMTRRSKQGSSGVQSQVSSTPGPVSSFSSSNVTAGSSSGWRSISLEILDASPQIGFINASKAGTWTAGYTHALPSGVQDDDLMLLFASAVSEDTLTTPPGWTLVRRDQNGSGTATWIFKKVAASESSGPTLTWNATHWHRSELLVFRGFSDIKTSDAVVYDQFGTGAPQLMSLDMPSVNGAAGDMLVGYGYAWADDTSKTLSIPNVVLTELDHGGSVVGYELLGSSGPTNPYTLQCTKVHRMTTYAVLLEPSEGAPGSNEETTAGALSAGVSLSATGTKAASATAASVTTNVVVSAAGSKATSSAVGALSSIVSLSATGSKETSSEASPVSANTSLSATGSLSASSSTSFGIEVEYVDASSLRSSASKLLPVKRTDIPQMLVTTAIPFVGVSTSLETPPVRTLIPTWTVSTLLPKAGISTGLPIPGVETGVEDPRTDTVIPDPLIDTHLSEDEV